MVSQVKLPTWHLPVDGFFYQGPSWITLSLSKHLCHPVSYDCLMSDTLDLSPGAENFSRYFFPSFWVSLLISGASQVALVVKNSPANAGDLREASSIPESGRSPGGGHGNPLQCSCLENPKDRGGWPATVQRVTKSQKQLSMSLNEHVYLFQRNDIWGLIIGGRCFVREICTNSEHRAEALSVAREGYDCLQQVCLVHWCQCI